MAGSVATDRHPGYVPLLSAGGLFDSTDFDPEEAAINSVAHLQHLAQLMRQVSEQAFVRARAKLSSTAIPSLNDRLVEQADQVGYVPRWQNSRLVAADASTMRFGLHASHVPRAACADQMYPSAEPVGAFPHG